MQDERRKNPEKERQDPAKPIDQTEREPFREPKRPFDPEIEREEEDVERDIQLLQTAN